MIRVISLMISCYPAKFGNHRPCGQGDVNLSNCHVISSDDVVRGSCNTTGEFPSS